MKWSADTLVRMSPKDEEKRGRSGDLIDRGSFGGGTADADKSVRAPIKNETITNRNI